jgi:iron(III) transport system ATP-binding protein
VLLDEPFSSLDAALREETGRTVARALRGSGATALLVTHDQAEALSLADHVAVLRDGRVAQVAAPQDLYRYPVDPGVAAFVGRVSSCRAARRRDTVACVLGMLHPLDPHVEGAVQVLVRPEQLEVDPEVPDGVRHASSGRASTATTPPCACGWKGVDEEVLARVHGAARAGPGRHRPCQRRRAHLLPGA